MYFSNWVQRCRQMRADEHQADKIYAFYWKNTQKLKSRVFNELHFSAFKLKSHRYYREQENLRRCLKTDLEEKFILKKKIHELRLQDKEKQIKL
jgi:hypothetical protein